MAHKTIALTSELKELARDSRHAPARGEILPEATELRKVCPTKVCANGIGATEYVRTASVRLRV